MCWKTCRRWGTAVRELSRRREIQRDGVRPRRAGSASHRVSDVGNGERCGGRWDGKEAFFAFSGFQTPSTIYRESVESGDQTVWSKLNVPVDTDAFEAKQVFYKSKDGTRIPMFVVHRKGLKLDGNNPTLLYGYGGFNNSLTPFFSAKAVLWMEHGGSIAWRICAVGANTARSGIRQGCEAASKTCSTTFTRRRSGSSPRNTLVRKSWRSREGAMVACSSEPRSHSVPSCSERWCVRIRCWTWSATTSSCRAVLDPRVRFVGRPAEFKTLRAYSPYHNVVEGGKYPATLFITGDADTRVDPLHARKMAALLQAKSGSGRPVLLRYDTKLGHTGARPVSKSVEDLADELSFLFGELEVVPPVAERGRAANRAGITTAGDR